MKFLRAVSGALAWIERSLVVILLSTTIIIAFLQVVLRNLFSTGFVWADPFLRHLVLWIGFLGASLATQQERHINIDVVTRLLLPQHTNLLRIATNLFAGLVCAFLARAGWTFLRSEQSTGSVLLTMGGFDLQAWWFQVIIPAGFGLMTLRFLIRTLEHVIAAFRHTAEEPRTTNIPTPSL